MYETLQSIVDQLEFCDYQTKDGLHELKMNAAFIALKERAAAEAVEAKRAHTPNKQMVGESPQIRPCSWHGSCGAVRVEGKCRGVECRIYDPA